MKRALFFIVIFFFTVQTFAQRRTTSVKGYYRKNGTYVSPHIRGYTAGSGSASSYSYTSSSTGNQEEKEINLTTLKVAKADPSNYDATTAKYIKNKGEKISPTSLNFINGDLAETDTSKTKLNGENKGVVFYVSVLRYKGITIDICPITRDYLQDWSFDKVKHYFDKNLIATDDALDLVSNYGWRINNDKISKDFSYSYNEKIFPKYLTKSIEAIKVE